MLTNKEMQVQKYIDDLQARLDAANKKLQAISKLPSYRCETTYGWGDDEGYGEMVQYEDGEYVSIHRVEEILKG